MAFIEKYVDSGLGVITLADSENGNRLNLASLTKLNEAVNDFINNDDVKTILLRSNGRKFCYGMDLNFLEKKHGEKEVVDKSIEKYTELLMKIHNSDKLIICVINGEVKAGGIGLISACDIIITTDTSTFELSEVLLGLIPANVIPFLLSRRLNVQNIRYIVTTAKKLNAGDALRIGLVDEVFSEEQLEKKTKSILKRIFRSSPDAIAQAKSFIDKILKNDFVSSIETAKEELKTIITKEEVINAVKAFNEGETPLWFKKFKPEKKVTEIN